MSRSEALWKEAATQSWFEKVLPTVLDQLDSSDAKTRRESAAACWTIHRDPIDEYQSIPLSVCRHVLTSESTAFQGFLPPTIRASNVHAFDPLPPSSATTAYDAEYFGGAPGGGSRGRGGSAAAAAEEGFMERIMGAIAQNPDNWRDAVRGVWGELMQGNMFRAMPREQHDNLLNVVSPTVGGKSYRVFC